MIQLSPPLVAGQHEFDEIARILGDVLTEAWGRAAPSVAPGDRHAWWLDEAPPDPAEPPLEGDVAVDVAIVGGGYTGLWTALALREREPGLDVAVRRAEFCRLRAERANSGSVESFWAPFGRLA